MKIAPLMDALTPYTRIRQVLVNTGQHYDEAMSKGFLRELALSRDGRQLAFTFGVPLREPWIIEHFLPLSKNGESRR